MGFNSEFKGLNFALHAGAKLNQKNSSRHWTEFP